MHSLFFTSLICILSTSLPLVGGRLRGLNLFEYVTISEKLSEPLAAYYMEQLMSALEYLHNLNIVHLAIKVWRVQLHFPVSLVTMSNLKEIATMLSTCGT